MATYCMGPAFGLDESTADLLRKFRWLFQLTGVVGSDSVENGLYSLPPRRAARPNLQFKSDSFQHVTETIYMPMKPDWQTMRLVLFDLKRCGQQNKYNVVYDWLRAGPPISGQGRPGMYDPRTANWTPMVDAGFKRTCQLLMLDSCGSVMETWVYENAYPESIDWGELEMDLSDLVTIEISLRFDRAYQLI